MMNVTEIRKYAKLMQELGLTALEITEDARTVRLERSVPVQQKEIIAGGYSQNLPLVWQVKKR